jgi:putative DNA primase/helicase
MSGILNMTLQAYARAVTSGFVEPASSKAAKDEWRVQSDSVALWLSECERADGASLGVKHCYDAFCAWANSAGVKQVPALKAFSQRVERLRVTKTKTPKGMVFDGIKVAAAEERSG